MNKAKGMLLGSMGIFGTIGIFVRLIPLPSSVIALCRAVLGLIFLFLVIALSGKKPAKSAILKNLPLLILSGAAMGFNWILLFESYRYTTIATATVCYYLAPLLLLLASPLLKEKLTGEKLLCVAVALLGLVCVSGVTEGTLPQITELTGIGLALGAAALYASVMFLNKKMTPIQGYDKTALQLLSASIVLLPYVLLTENLDSYSLNGLQWVILAVVGIIHTGVAYTLYFSSIENLSAKTIGVLCYLDPVIAVVLSALLLKEPMNWVQVLGSCLILGSALYSELPKKRT